MIKELKIGSPVGRWESRGQNRYSGAQNRLLQSTSGLLGHWMDSHCSSLIMDLDDYSENSSNNTLAPSLALFI